jgi:hypothetical protein
MVRPHDRRAHCVSADAAVSPDAHTGADHAHAHQSPITPNVGGTCRLDRPSPCAPAGETDREHNHIII